MATVIATINVTFTSNFAGCHRLFWRRGSVGPLNGPVEATPPCTGSGNPCTISFYDVVDTEACANINYEGYVQACCQDVASLDGRVPFSVTYVPSPVCRPLELTCARVVVDSLKVINPGSQYNPALPPAVSITGGGGLGATATAIVGTGGITGTNFIDQGVGPDQPAASYPVFPVLTFGVINIVGTGTVANCTATSLNNLPDPTCPVNGCTYLATLTIVSDSGDWSVGDTFQIDPSAIGNIGNPLYSASLVTVQVTSTDLGTITGFTLTSPGSGFTSQPLVSIAPPPVGIDVATASAVLAGCTDGWVAGENCMDIPGSYSPYPIEPELNQSFIMCFQDATVTTGSIPADYDVAPSSECCSTCVRYQIVNNSGETIEAAWISCDTTVPATFKDVISATINDGDTLQICCAVEESLSLTYTTGVVVTSPGPCNCTP